MKYYEEDMKFTRDVDMAEQGASSPDQTRTIKEYAASSNNIGGEYVKFNEILKPFCDKVNSILKEASPHTFALKNIYCVDTLNPWSHNAARINKLLKQRSIEGEFKKDEKTNILIIIPSPTPAPIRIKQPGFTRIVFLLAPGARLDYPDLITDKTKGESELVLMDYDASKSSAQSKTINVINAKTNE